MITCDECGHVNRLGAIYCGACGAKLDVNMEVIEGSVLATASEIRAQKFFVAGRSAIVLGIFLLISSIVFNIYFVPDIPKPQLPRSEPQKAEQIFPHAVNWVQPSLDNAPAINIEDLITESPLSLLAWRQQTFNTVMGDIDTSAVTNWQIEIFNSRNVETGTWDGPDKIASTAFALLALMAKPGPDNFDEAIAEGVEFLKAQILRNSSGKDPLAHTLAVMALVESGTLSERALSIVRPALYRGNLPNWQALALLSFPPEVRPSRIAAIRANTTDSLWRHYLHFLSDKPMIESLDESLFVTGAGKDLEGADRLAWASVSFWMGRNLDDLKTTLEAWNEDQVPPAAPEDLRSLTGPQADLCMAVLAATAPVRAPIPWIRPAAK